MNATKTTIKAAYLTNHGDYAQETYETGSGHARRRAANLRKAGYTARCSQMGRQITPWGMAKLTMIDVRPGCHRDTFDLPAVELLDCNHDRLPPRTPTRRYRCELPAIERINAG